MESYILSDNDSRSLIESALRPSDITKSTHDTLASTNNRVPAQSVDTITEVEVPEIEMAQELTSELTENLGKTEILNQVLGQDINETPCYETRNRVHQSINLFHVIKNGKYAAGALIGNTLGDTKADQIKYLANILRLAPNSTHLIQTIFHNGNGWYTFNFEFAIDLESCLNKINGKKEENFRLIVLHNPDYKESNSIPETTNLSKQRQPKVVSNMTKEKQVENISQTTSKSTRSKYQISKNEPSKATTPKGKNKSNSFNIIETQSYYQLRVRCATIPGNNREKQLQNLAEILQIPLESDLIQISCIGKSKLAVLNFENPEDMRACRKELLENLPSCDTFICGKDSDQDSFTSDNSQIEDLSYTTIKLVDIPKDFSSSRVKGAIQKYGEVIELKFTEGNNHFKSATVTFNQLKLDLENTWAIPMGDVMARLTPIENCESILTQRNSITSRLYGISSSTSATRIMSATKHLGVKTVYIPRNSKTNRRRGFAIIGFSSQKDLQKALAAHVELFGLRTWWSTKDNQKLNSKRRNTDSLTQIETHIIEDDNEDNMSTISIHSSTSSSYPVTPYPVTLGKKNSNSRTKQSDRLPHRKSSARSKKRQQETSVSDISLVSITAALQDIAKRLDSLEERKRRGRLPNCF